MASYTDLPGAKAAAVATLTAAASTNGWPASVLTGALQSVDAAYYSADGWFSSNAAECETFWAQLHSSYATWDGSQKGMDKIGTWLAAEAYLTESKAATAEAQSATTIAGGTVDGAIDDAGAIVAAGADAATTVNTLAKSQTAWIVGGIGLLALLLWKVAR